MRKLLSGVMVLAALAFASTSQATDGTIEMAWNGCVGLPDIASPAAAGQYSLYVSEVGNNVQHQAYQVRVIYGDNTQNVPDAWRFDAAGCQGSSFITIDHLAPATVVKTCPSFQGALQSLQIKDTAFTPPTDPYATTTMRLVLANAYPVGTVGNGGRMFLARFLFDHSFSVAGPTDPGNNCGGFEKSMCFKLSVGTYLDMSTPANEIPFVRNVAPGAPLFVTFNGDGGACAAVPAKSATWGSIKGQYRN